MTLNAFWAEKAFQSRGFVNEGGQDPLSLDSFSMSKNLTVFPDLFSAGLSLESGEYVNAVSAYVWVNISDSSIILKVSAFGLNLPGFTEDPNADPNSAPTPMVKQINQNADIVEALDVISQALINKAKNYLSQVALKVP